MCFPFPSSFCCNQYYPIGTRISIDCSRRGVFQYCYTFYFGRVNGFRVTGRHSIHHVQRFVSRIDRRRSPDTNRETFVRFSRRGDNLHSRRTSGKRRTEVINGNVFNILCQDGRYSARYIFLFLYAIAYYDHLIQFLHIFFQGYIQHPVVSNSFFLGQITEKRVLEDFIRMADFELVLTIYIGHHSITASFHHHTDPYHRLTGNIRDLPRHTSDSSRLRRFRILLTNSFGDADSFVVDIERYILSSKQIIQYIFYFLLFDIY